MGVTDAMGSDALRVLAKRRYRLSSSKGGDSPASNECMADSVTPPGAM